MSFDQPAGRSRVDEFINLVAYHKEEEEEEEEESGQEGEER